MILAYTELLKDNRHLYKLNFKEYPSKVEEEKGGFEKADASAKF